MRGKKAAEKRERTLHCQSPIVVSLFPLTRLYCFPTWTCCDNLSPLQALFTHAENTIVHQRCPGARHKWEAEKPKQGQNERQESTVAVRTMPANYGSQSAAEQAADLKRVCLRVINLNEISHISCIKCEVNISIINVSFHNTPGAPWESGLRHDSNVICVHTYWGTCLKRKRWWLSDTRAFSRTNVQRSQSEIN